MGGGNLVSKGLTRWRCDALKGEMLPVKPAGKKTHRNIDAISRAADNQPATLALTFTQPRVWRNMHDMARL